MVKVKVSESEFILFYPSSGSINMLLCTVIEIKSSNNMKILTFENNLLQAPNIDTTWHCRDKGDS